MMERNVTQLLNRRTVLALAATLSLMALTGCGGSGSKGGQGATDRSARVTFNVAWPERTRVLPDAAERVDVEVYDGDRCLYGSADGCERQQVILARQDSFSRPSPSATPIPAPSPLPNATPTPTAVLTGGTLTTLSNLPVRKPLTFRVRVLGKSVLPNGDPAPGDAFAEDAPVAEGTVVQVLKPGDNSLDVSPEGTVDRLELNSADSRFVRTGSATDTQYSLAIEPLDPKSLQHAVYVTAFDAENRLVPLAYNAAGDNKNLTWTGNTGVSLAAPGAKAVFTRNTQEAGDYSYTVTYNGFNAPKTASVKLAVSVVQKSYTDRLQSVALTLPTGFTDAIGGRDRNGVQTDISVIGGDITLLSGTKIKGNTDSLEKTHDMSTNIPVPVPTPTPAPSPTPTPTPAPSPTPTPTIPVSDANRISRSGSVNGFVVAGTARQEMRLYANNTGQIGSLTRVATQSLTGLLDIEGGASIGSPNGNAGYLYTLTPGIITRYVATVTGGAVPGGSLAKTNNDKTLPNSATYKRFAVLPNETAYVLRSDNQVAVLGVGANATTLSLLNLPGLNPSISFGSATDPTVTDIAVDTDTDNPDAQLLFILDRSKSSVYAFSNATGKYRYSLTDPRLARATAISANSKKMYVSYLLGDDIANVLVYDYSAN